jgi:hypothetical protein
MRTVLGKGDFLEKSFSHLLWQGEGHALPWRRVSPIGAKAQSFELLSGTTFPAQYPGVLGRFGASAECEWSGTVKYSDGQFEGHTRRDNVKGTEGLTCSSTTALSVKRVD